MRDSEKDLSEKERYYRTLIHSLHEDLLVIDREFRITDINNMALKTLGKTRQKAIGRFCYKVSHGLNEPCDEHGSPCPLHQVFDTGEPVSYRHEHVSSDGTNVNVDILASPIKDSEGNVTHVIEAIRDITERKQVEETLRASEERLQLAADAAQMGQWDWNIVTGEVVWSQQCLALYGLPPDTPMNYERFLQTLHPEDRESVGNALRRAVEDRTSYDEVKRTVWPDGSIHWTASRGQVYCDATGQPIRMIGVTFDVTKWKEAEKALKESEAKYMDLYENAPDMYVSVNAKTALIEECNKTLVNTLGCSKEEIIGRPVFDIYHPDCLEEVKETFKFFVETGEVHDKELQLQRKGGLKIDVSLNVTSVRDENGHILYSRSTLRDITERKRNDLINSARLHLIQFAATHSLDELLEETLNEAERLTGSLIGFYHFVEDDQQSLTLQNWSTRTKAEFCKAEGKGLHYAISDAGVWVDCAHQRKPVIHNDYASLSHRKGMPQGHAEVIRELVVPVLRSNKIKAILGVGNKPFDYTETDVEAILLLADLAWEIAERKQAESDLKESEERYRAIVAGFDGLIYICSQDYRVEFMNDKFIRRTGYYPKGELCYKALHELDSVCPWCLNERVFKGETVRWEVKSPKDDRWYYVVNTPIFHADGSVSKQAMILDITERKKAEEELDKHREHLEELVRDRTVELEIARNKAQQYLDIAGVILVAIDADQRVTLINQKGCEVLGGDPGDIIGKDWFETFVPANIRQDVIQTFHRLMAGEIEPVEYFENPVLTQDGQKRLIAWHNALLRDDGGNIVGTLSSGEDITEHKHAEDQIRSLNQNLRERAVALEVANKELEAFAYSVSHDLRAPLRHIDGFLELLKSKTAEVLDEQSRHYMAAISDSAIRMSVLIEDLLAFSQMGSYEMSKEPVDVSILVQEVIREFEPDTGNRNINWRLGDLPMVIGDRTMLHMVLFNLISNALKFTQPRQQAEIEIGCMPDTKTEMIIFVRDNGVGFDMKYADKLFGVFQRLHRADEFEGTGIGLANVRRIINRHGGRTWATGELNQGATICFSLPQI